MSDVKIPWATCRDVPVTAAAACKRDETDRKWYRCLECSEKVSLTRAHKRKFGDDSTTHVRAFFSHVNKETDCRGGGLMTYVHSATQTALAAYRGECTVYCGSGACAGAKMIVSEGRTECRNVKPYSVDVVLITSCGELAVEVTKTHKTDDAKWQCLVDAYGAHMVCEVDVSKCAEDATGRFKIVVGKEHCAVTDDCKLEVQQAGLCLKSRECQCAVCQEAQEKAKLIAREQIAEYERKGFVKCSRCKTYTKKGAQQTYLDFRQRCKVTNCCGWTMCSKCDRKAICLSSYERVCIACKRNKLSTTDERCDATDECKWYSVKGHEWGYCRYHYSWKSCINCGFGFKPQLKWHRLCRKCQYKSPDVLKKERVAAMFAKSW